MWFDSRQPACHHSGGGLYLLERNGKEGAAGCLRGFEVWVCSGVEGFCIDVEADLSQGLPGFDVVGLPGAAVRESQGPGAGVHEKLRLYLSGQPDYGKPCTRRRSQEGSVYDLPLLRPAESERTAPRAAGRRGLCRGTVPDREVRPVRGCYRWRSPRGRRGSAGSLSPAGNAAEGAVVDGIEVYPVTTVAALLTHFFGRSTPAARPAGGFSRPVRRGWRNGGFCRRKGAAAARRALEVAAAGSTISC